MIYVCTPKFIGPSKLGRSLEVFCDFEFDMSQQDCTHAQIVSLL